MDAGSALAAEQPRIGLNQRVEPLHLIVALMLLAGAVRMLGLGARPLWLDEAFSAWFSEQNWHYLWAVVPTFEAHPPFYYSLLKLWSGLFGGKASALRGLSVLFAMLTIPVVVAIAFEQNRRPNGQAMFQAGVAAFLVACSPLLVMIGQEARPYPLLTLAYAVAILGLFRLMRQLRNGGPGSWAAWALFGVGTEITLWAHALGLLYGLCLALALAPAWLGPERLGPERLGPERLGPERLGPERFGPERFGPERFGPERFGNGAGRARIGRGFVAAAAIGLFYVPCLLMMLGRVSDWQANWLHWHPDMLLQLVGLYSVPGGELTIGAAVATLVMLMLIKRAFQAALEDPGWNADRVMLLVWLGPPLLAALVSALVAPVFLARTLAATLVPAYLAIAAALARTPSLRERTLLTAALCATMAIAAVHTALRPSSEPWDEVSAFLAGHVSAGDQIWLYPGDSALPLAHVAPVGLPMRALPAPFPTLGFTGPIRAGWAAMVSLSQAQAAQIANDARIGHVPTIWLVTRQSGIFDPRDDLPNALARIRRPGRPNSWGYIEVRPYYLRPAS